MNNLPGGLNPMEKGKKKLGRDLVQRDPPVHLQANATTGQSPAFLRQKLDPCGCRADREEGSSDMDAEASTWSRQQQKRTVFSAGTRGGCKATAARSLQARFLEESPPPPRDTCMRRMEDNRHFTNHWQLTARLFSLKSMGIKASELVSTA